MDSSGFGKRRFACKIDTGAGVNVKESPDYVNLGTRFTIQWFKATQIDAASIVKSRIESDLGANKALTYTRLSPSHATVEKDSQKEWRSALSEIEKGNPLGHYELNGKLISLTAQRLTPTQSSFKDGRSLSVTIAGPGAYISIGTCEPAE